MTHVPSVVTVQGGEAGESALVVGDNLGALARRRDDLAGQVRLAYLDPPYATGSAFRARVPIGSEAAPSSLRERRMGDALAYEDRFPDGIPGLVAMLRPRLALIRELLAPGGSLVVHADIHAGPAIKTLADEVFGPGRLRNAIAWHYYNKLHDRRKRALPSAFDILWWYATEPDDAVVYHPQEERRDKPVRQLVRRKVGGRAVNARGPDGALLYRERTTRGLDNVWRIPGVQPAARDEFVHFETQKPLRLLHRLLAMTTRPGDLVLDPFLGSGTTAVAAHAAGRRFVGIDARPLGVHLTRKRLLAPGQAAASFRLDDDRDPAAAPLGPEGAVAVVDGAGDRSLRWTRFTSPTLPQVVDLPEGGLTTWDEGLDYWCVDWAYDGRRFRDRWRAFRSRRDRTLPLEVRIPEGVVVRDIRVIGVDPIGNATPPLSLAPESPDR